MNLPNKAARSRLVALHFGPGAGATCADILVSPQAPVPVQGGVSYRFNATPLTLAPGARLIAARQDIPPYTTNAAGIAEVPLGPPGLQLLVVEHEIPSASPALCDKERAHAT